MTLLDLSTSFTKQKRQRMNLNGSITLFIIGARSFAKIIKELEKTRFFLAFVSQLFNALFCSMKYNLSLCVLNLSFYPCFVF